uniref:leucine-rich repeats and immunoglobulin-like domains protein 2 n=1 Tax=Styela clava TaxID=7725 RepID=UPI00193A5CDD|nr:leucine-rich repeats and immunoglobulin-like domains protein 2 [Styela clava]
MASNSINEYIFKLLVLFGIVHITLGSTACDVCVCQPTADAPFLTSCSNPNLTTVPDNIINTTKIFIANDGSIQNITAMDFAGLTLLEQLELNNNKISTIEDDSFKDLISLTTLKVASNALNQLSIASLNGLPNLTHLEINDNMVTTVPDHVCSKLTSLQSLSAQDNKITTIGSQVLMGCDSLNHIDLSNNGITAIDEDAFKGLDSLATLDITGNKLTAFYSAWFVNKSSSINFKFDNNATWYCNVQMKDEYAEINKTHPSLLSCNNANGFCPLCDNFGGVRLTEIIITERTVTVSTTTVKGETEDPSATTACNNMTATCPGSGFKNRPDIFLLLVAMLMIILHQ